MTRDAQQAADAEMPERIYVEGVYSDGEVVAWWKNDPLADPDSEDDATEYIRKDVARREMVEAINKMLTAAYVEHDKREGKYGSTCHGLSLAHVLIDDWIGEQEAKEVSVDEA